MATQATTETEQGAIARLYASLGWRVFPLWWPIDGRCACPQGAACTSPAKHPLSVKIAPGQYAGAPRGVKDATADEHMVRAWWARWPHANIGLPAGDNDLAVIDIDPAHGGDISLAKLTEYLGRRGETLPPTLTAITGSGGQHLIYAAPDGGIKSGANVLGPNMPGLDTRGRGGYIVAAPSVHASGRQYTWANFADLDPQPWPEIMTRLMDPPAPPTPARPARQVEAGDRYAQSALDRELVMVAQAVEGCRNATLNTSAYNLGQLIGAGLLDQGTVEDALHGAGRAIGLSEHETRATIRSGLRSGMAKPRQRVAS